MSSKIIQNGENIINIEVRSNKKISEFDENKESFLHFLLDSFLLNILYESETIKMNKILSFFLNLLNLNENYLKIFEKIMSFNIKLNFKQI